MNFLKHVKLKLKMVYAFLLIISLMFIAVGFAIFGLDKNKDQIANMRLISQEAELAAEIESDLLDGQLIFKDFLNTGTAELLVEFEMNEQLMDECIEQLRDLTTNKKRINFISDIENEIRAYNIGFNRFEQLDNERAEYYSVLSRDGGNIVLALDSLTLIAQELDDTETQLILGEATGFLLQARLHGMKFFTFHEEAEFRNYEDDFEQFIKQIDKLYYIKNDINYKIEYNLLRSSSTSYKAGMLELFDLINEIDDQIVAMDLKEDSVKNTVALIIQSVQEDELRLEDEVKKQTMLLTSAAVFIGTGVLILTFFIANWLIRVVLVPIGTLKTTFDDIAKGDVDMEFRLPEKYDDEIGQMSKAFNTFMVNLKEIMDSVNLQNWTKTAQNELNKVIRAPENIHVLSKNILSFICQYVEAEIGTMYIAEDDKLHVASTYAYTNRKGIKEDIKFGEGLIGQCGIERNAFIVTDLPEGYLNIQSGLGENQPNNVLVFPCEYENSLKAVIEIGTFKTLTEKELNLLRALSDAIAISIHATTVQDQLKELLDRTMTQSEELQMQQEELRQSNEELEEQTRALKESEQRLQAQQEELRVSNEELEQRTKQLEIQKNALDDNNKDILRKQQEIIEKAEALELANTYKSEFLANMSHELRTPLNSILVLSQLLSERENSKPLSSKETEFADTIHTSGKDLLTLINDVLDLSKVEAGHLDITHEEIHLKNLLMESERMFKPLTDVKAINFRTELKGNVPDVIISDSHRIQQIIKNLVSNSIKFTEKGEVLIKIRKPSAFECDSINCDIERYIAIEVSDTGMGIPKDKLQIIFEAFRQSDGTTSRKYGGTGLGLTISRELAHLLGGQIIVESTIGEGSQFVFLLPINQTEVKQTIEVEKKPEILPIKEVIEQMKVKEEEEAKELPEKFTINNSLLIIEDDMNFSKILAGLAEEKGYKCFIANDGKSGMEMAISIKPTAIVLDLGLPDINGMELAEKLGRLEATKSIPIHIISGMDQDKESLLPTSVIGFLKKPVDIKAIYKTLAKIEEVSQNDSSRLLVIGACGGENFDQFASLGNMYVDKVLTTESAFEMLNAEVYNCIVLDIEMYKIGSENFINELSSVKGGIPIIVYSEKELDNEILQKLSGLSDNIILKSPKSTERLMDEVSLFLHGMESTIEEHSNTSDMHLELVMNELKHKLTSDDVFEGKRVLIVDDDDRNVFALSNVLMQHKFKQDVAKNGIECVQKIHAGETYDLILMDIMMPKMDGYETIQAIRQLPKMKDVPIIALTAKAMKDDRKKCIDAGANDYLTKPIDIEKLLSTLKVWLS